jgi:hypothetical protein
MPAGPPVERRRRAPRSQSVEFCSRPTRAGPPGILQPRRMMSLLASSPTDYAVVNRYPGEYEEVSDVDYEEAISLASVVISWAERIVHGQQAQ